ncbi:MAG: dockerin type I repeat-containing protein [Oscillospiraceae bacterium]|nr:dockerin type I repeat-containing protein [Oscillospiraceae bacterium]
MKFKKLIAMLTACVAVCNCFSVLNAFAESEKINIAIDEKVVSTEQLQAMNYQVPVFVNLTQNAGINSAECIINVDARCNYEVITDLTTSFELTNENLIFSMISSNKFEDNSCRLLWAGAKVVNSTGAIVLLMVQIPEDAVNGDVFEISYLPNFTYNNYEFEHLWGIVGSDVKNYVLANEVSWSNGKITIQDEEITDSGDSGIMLGDVTLDGVVSIGDVVLTTRAVLGKESLTDKQLKAADFNQNGMPEAIEALKIMEYVVGLISSFTD